MDLELLQYIRCPACNSSLSLIDKRNNSISGILCCLNNHCYPIINDVPVLIHNNYLRHFISIQELNDTERLLNGTIKSDPYCKSEHNAPMQTLLKNSTHWSYEWLHAHFYEDSIWKEKKTFNEHIPVDLSKISQFANVLDVGCGTGINIRHIKTENNRVFAIDISESVYSAQKKYRSLNNVFIIRCDVHLLPFKDNFFNLVFADHVLSHVPDLAACLGQLKRVSHKQNLMIFNVYSKENNFILLRIIEPIKKYACIKYMSNDLLYLFAVVPAFFLWISITCIYKPLYNKAEYLYRFLPLSEHMIFWFSFSYQLLRITCFDLLQAVETHFYSKDMIDALCLKNNLTVKNKYLLRRTMWVCEGTFT